MKVNWFFSEIEKDLEFETVTKEKEDLINQMSNLRSEIEKKMELIGAEKSIQDQLKSELDAKRNVNCQIKISI